MPRSTTPQSAGKRTSELCERETSFEKAASGRAGFPSRALLSRKLYFSPFNRKLKGDVFFFCFVIALAALSCYTLLVQGVYLMTIGQRIAERRKAIGLTQQRMADALHVSFQAVSKWENGASLPDVALLAPIAQLLHTSVDALIGYHPAPATEYEQRYQSDDYYWGIQPNRLCYEIMQRKPPVRPYRVLDIGCGEGKDAVFLARNGYAVTAFDIADSGLAKAQLLAEHHGVHVDFFKADVLEFQPNDPFDIVFSSGVFHYLPPAKRSSVIQHLKEHTAENGLHVINVFVDKPFIAPPPDAEAAETAHPGWKSGELFMHYHDWLLHKTDERIFDCQSGGVPHRHCMDVVIAEKIPCSL